MTSYVITLGGRKIWFERFGQFVPRVPVLSRAMSVVDVGDRGIDGCPGLPSVKRKKKPSQNNAGADSVTEGDVFWFKGVEFTIWTTANKQCEF